MNLKFKFLSNKDKIQELRNQLESTQSIAKKYLRIVENFDNHKGISEEDYNYLLANSGILQMKMMKLKPQIGVIHYKRPFDLGVFPDFEIISNFPNLLKDRLIIDEAFTLAPVIRGALSTYINMVEDIIKDNKKLRILFKKGKNNKSKLKIIKEDKIFLYTTILAPIYVASLPLLFYPITFYLGLTLNIVSVSLIVLVSLLTKSE